LYILLAGSGQAALKIGDVPPSLSISSVVQGPTNAIFGWKDFKGKVVVLEFWGTRCSPCVEAIPHFNALADQFQNKPVVFLCVSDDNKGAIQDFLKKTPIHGWVAVDGPLSATASAFDITAIPRTFILDASGKIAASTHPMKLEASHLEEILAGKPCSLPFPKDNSKSEAVEDKEVIPKSLLAEVSIHGPFPKPTANGGAYNMHGWSSESCFQGKRAYLKSVLESVFFVDSRMIFEETNLPEGLYDITLVAPPGKTNELREQFLSMLKTTFSISVEVTIRDVEIYDMTVCSTNSSGRKLTDEKGGGGQKPGGFSFKSCWMRTIADYLSDAVNKPVIDETGDMNRYQVDIKWEMGEAERLQFQIDKRVARIVDTNTEMILSGKLPKELRDTMTDRQYELLRQEVAKPDDRRFQPDPALVIKAAREQLGLDLVLKHRMLPVIVVRKADSSVLPVIKIDEASKK